MRACQSKQSFHFSLLAGLLLILTFCLYYQGLSGGFLFDDSGNITENTEVQATEFTQNQLVTAAFSSNSGPLKRPISMLSFAIDHVFTGMDPWHFKLTNLLIHLLTGVGIIILSRMLLKVCQQRFQPELTDGRIIWISLAVGGAWLMHPFNLTGVLYIVQRMTSLAALFTVAGLIVYCLGRKAMGFGDDTESAQSVKGMFLILVSIVVFGALAAFSKENGILLVLFIFILEWSLFGFQAPEPRSRTFLLSVQVVCIAIPLVIGLFYLGINPMKIAGSYGHRDFTLAERLWTEGRIIWFYIQMILLPDVTHMGLFHDDIQLSTGWLNPMTTLPALLTLGLLLLLAILMRKRAPMLCFGLLFFFVGHSMESTVISLELVFEHRNYLPGWGLLLPFFYYVLHPKTAQKLALPIPIALAGGLMLACAIGTANRVHTWSNNFLLALHNVKHHPASARSNLYMGSQFLQLYTQAAEQGDESKIKEFLQQARFFFDRGVNYDNYHLHGYFGLLRVDGYEGNPVNEDLMQRLSSRLQHGSLSTTAVGNLVNTFHQQLDTQDSGISEAQLIRLTEAILKNPKLGGHFKAMVLTNMLHHALKNDAIPVALEHARAILKINPASLDTQMNLTYALIRAGQKQAARQQLGVLKQMDRHHALADDVDVLENMLKQF